MDGYIKVADFGVSKKISKGGKTHTMVGTPEYLAPELIKQEGHNETADFWAFGILLYELSTGVSPFNTKSKGALMQSIIHEEITFPVSARLSAPLKDLISKVGVASLQLLIKDPAKRLGAANGAEDIKNHPFFAKVNWDKLLSKKVRFGSALGTCTYHTRG